MKSYFISVGATRSWYTKGSS